MEKINFVNGTSPALNATNLNQMQDNIENAINEVNDAIPEIVDNLTTEDATKALSAKQGKELKKAISDLPTMPIYSYTAENIEWFKNYAIADVTPIGISFWDLTLSSSKSMAIVIKASDQYLSFIHFSYAVNAIQYKYSAGTWSTKDL